MQKRTLSELMRMKSPVLHVGSSVIDSVSLLSSALSAHGEEAECCETSVRCGAPWSLHSGGPSLATRRPDQTRVDSPFNTGVCMHSVHSSSVPW